MFLVTRDFTTVDAFTFLLVLVHVYAWDVDVMGYVHVHVARGGVGWDGAC